MTQSRTSIVCGVDGSAGYRVATGVAAKLAAALDARLVLVHAVPDPPVFPYGDAHKRELARGRAVRAGHRLLEAGADDLDAVLRVTLGDPVDGLHTVCSEEDAELLVVGSRCHAGLAGALIGSVSARVASGARCPVVIVPPEAGPRFIARGTPRGSIICGFDGSHDSERAMEVAVALAERMGLEPLAIFVDPARRRTASVPSPVEVLTGDPVHELRERATHEDVRLIAVGSRGRSALRGALLGSVSASLAASASVPVLVVPPTARVPGPFDAGDGARSTITATR
jgi:nucleotide-binding universal stress UspA family protein